MMHCPGVFVDSPMPQHSVKIAFLTSGGDSPGMNAAIRAIVRMAICKNCVPFAVKGGYQGLVDGGDNIQQYAWEDVAYILSEGGTFIRSSRCEDFKTREGRLKAANNLVNLGITNLIVIGGDGSLTGADLFRNEWQSLIHELLENGAITEIQGRQCEFLMVVGLVGSIDNDMYGTERTIGADSSLHRIIEAVDNISTTASSHSRAFIIEVMGRKCGWLALNACVAIGADYLFIPEDPPSAGWQENMKKTVKRRWERRGKMSTIVIICEGAVDRDNNPIKSEQVRSILEECGLDARVTTLGHIQRGGSPSAFDRYLATLQGVEAVNAILESDPSGTPSLMIGIQENRITRLPLVECVAKTREIATLMQNGKFEEARAMRGFDFSSNYEILGSFYRLEEAQAEGTTASQRRIRLAFVNCGAPCGGINSANRAIILYCLLKGYVPIGVFNGFSGFIKGDLQELTLADGPFHSSRGGSFLGMNRSLPGDNIEQISSMIASKKIDALIIIGGFEGYSAQLQLNDARSKYSNLNIPIAFLPATVSNNVPGTDYSIGCDTALNIIVQCADSLKQSASSSRKRTFIVDVQGGMCGFLATMAGLACGATYSYIPEEGVCLNDLIRDVRHLKQRFSEDKYQGRLILRNEKASDIFNAELIAKIFGQESNGLFDVRWVSLGHLQQGGSPSPLDRIRATRLAVLCCEFIEKVVSTNKTDLIGAQSTISRSLDSLASFKEGNSETPCVVIGIRGHSVVFSSAHQLLGDTDLDNRRPLRQWWMGHRELAKLLAKYLTSSE